MGSSPAREVCATRIQDTSIAIVPHESHARNKLTISPTKASMLPSLMK